MATPMTNELRIVLTVAERDAATSVDDAMTAGANIARAARSAPWGDLAAPVIPPEGMRRTSFGAAED